MNYFRFTGIKFCFVLTAISILIFFGVVRENRAPMNSVDSEFDNLGHPKSLIGAENKKTIKTSAPVPEEIRMRSSVKVISPEEKKIIADLKEKMKGLVQDSWVVPDRTIPPPPPVVDPRILETRSHTSADSKWVPPDHEIPPPRQILQDAKLIALNTKSETPSKWIEPQRPIPPPPPVPSR